MGSYILSERLKELSKEDINIIIMVLRIYYLVQSLMNGTNDINIFEDIIKNKKGNNDFLAVKHSLSRAKLYRMTGKINDFFKEYKQNKPEITQKYRQLIEYIKEFVKNG